mmetsp:Transcript_73156/g.169680  ORF Transcript_73156/g.169680 Transcript_73156/m.169680 type:complete len:209 (-) Transcript_73156:308-934(-)
MVILSEFEKVRKNLPQRHAAPGTLPPNLCECGTAVWIRVVVRGHSGRGRPLTRTLLLLPPPAPLSALGLPCGGLLTNAFRRSRVGGLRWSSCLRCHSHAVGHAWRHHRHARVVVHGWHRVGVCISHPGRHCRRVGVHAVRQRWSRVHSSKRSRGVPVTSRLRWQLRLLHLRRNHLRLWEVWLRLLRGCWMLLRMLLPRLALLFVLGRP